MIRKVSAYDLSQPLTLSWDGFMHSTLQFFLESPQPGPHPIAARLPLARNLPLENGLFIARDLRVGNRKPGASRFFATRKNVTFLVVGRANI